MPPLAAGTAIKELKYLAMSLPHHCRGIFGTSSLQNCFTSTRMEGFWAWTVMGLICKTLRKVNKVLFTGCLSTEKTHLRSNGFREWSEELQVSPWAHTHTLSKWLKGSQNTREFCTESEDSTGNKLKESMNRTGVRTIWRQLRVFFRFN